MKFRSTVLVVAVGAVLLGAGQVSALDGKKTVTVAMDGSGDFNEIQAAVDTATAAGLVVKIKPGLYKQKLHIPANGVELRGLGAAPDDVVLSWDDSAKIAGGTGKSGSVTITGDDFYAENLTIENGWERTHPAEHEGSQAVAVLITGDRGVFRHVRLLGFQDTLYAASKTCHAPEEIASGSPCRASRQYFVDCYIEGHVDFIFGDAKAVFDHCELHGMAHSTVMLSAQSRLFPGEDSGYLFKDCIVTAAPGADNILLGRPWRAYATVVFLNTDFKAKLNPAGWSDWDGRLKTASYAEFGSHGNSGAVQQRIAGSKVLTQAEAGKITVTKWLDGWDAAAVR